ncbi:efflux RND transporter periplasmic adaptor subunit [Pseudoalteromonas sp. McH1-7]|uniref:efflux RND transporter periplasmic adaptor subunit n=1 Tax=Pseudoalteromonas sp. McH1-7 TaxID=2745574 RepID=UPI00159036CC|nr:efflux RND transporter periplasmic adaptor subunit [Pseudoalteromonas sp. McH1-7]NUZ13304.1 efflux RND transporter periplasmic adaptor subunit [Pseudoalteromonas sp. McH1-7]
MNIKRWLIAFVLILIVITSLGFVKFTQIQAAIAFGESFPEPSASVKSTYVSTTEHLKTVKVVGQLHAKQTVTVSNEYAGLITYVGFQPGDLVKANQILLRLDSSIDEANLQAAKARVKLAKSTYQRVAKLLEQKRISPDEVDKAEAEVAINEADVKRLTTLIEKKTIRAPFTGYTGMEQYQVGQLLDANNAVTFLVGTNDKIWVDFNMPQTLPQPKLGEEVMVAVSHSQVQQPARVLAKTPSVDVASRQQRYRAELNNYHEALSHNQMVMVNVPVAKVSAAVVPTNAITRNHFGEFVYILEKDDAQNWRAKPVKVTLGDKIHDQQLVLTGLSGGEFIAAEGAFKLQENLLVYTDQVAAIDGNNGEQ